MQKIIFLILISSLSSCAILSQKDKLPRSPHPLNQIDFSSLPQVIWHFSNTDLILSSPYTPFFVERDQVTFFSGGPGASAANGVFKIVYKLNESSERSKTKIITTGPDPINYNYFRAARVAKDGKKLWMLIETAECYSGCDTTKVPRRLSVYHSKNNGSDWTFLDFLHVDGKVYDDLWMAHSGFVFNKQGSDHIETEDLTRNRFITIGENKNILISADGINYKSVPIEHPFAADQLVFASIARTPFGFHMTSASNWDANYYTTTIRHLFSKDLRHWIPIEFTSHMKNPKHFKGVHLSYDETAKKLWAVSSCGTKQPCGLMGWIEAKDYSMAETKPPSSLAIPNGEYVSIDNQTAMVIASKHKGDQRIYKIRYTSGVYETEIPEQKLILFLKNYKRFGCTEDRLQFCIGDPVKIDDTFGSVLGFANDHLENTHYAIKLLDGTIRTEIPVSGLARP
jgi:hypothetical protein